VSVFAAGQTVSHYRIVRPLGAGGMGEVYPAEDTKLGRQVALKVPPPEFAHDVDRRARFEREARAVAALNHPGIVTIHSVEEDQGVLFITMELVEGRTLAQMIAAAGLPLGELLKIAIPLADAVGTAHQRGITHRDLKPANVMIGGDGRVKVLDFGLAKQQPQDVVQDETALQPTAHATVEGKILGTIAYMSPEQAQGKPVDQRSDIFSLGVVLFEMATGQRPFTGDSSVTVLSSVLRDTPPLVSDLKPDLPRELGRIVRHCLVKDPDERYQTARDLRNDLKALKEDSVTPASGVSGPVPPAPATTTTAAWKRLAPAAALIAIFLAAAAFWRRGASATEPAGAIRSVAVLPLDNYSSDTSQEYFAEGMTDELTSDLASISQLRVTSRGSAMQFKGSHRPATPEIAKALDVDAIVEGSVIRSGDRVRITAQLIDARADRHLWGETFERKSSDVLALQAELASAVATAINVQLTPREQSRLAAAPSINPEAHDAYLKGRYFFNRPNDENLQKAIEQFDEVVKLSPTFAPAYSGLSDAYAWAAYNEWFIRAADAKPRVKEAAERAVLLDSMSAEAHTSLGVYKAWFEYDWDGAEQELRRAIALNPNCAYAHDQLHQMLSLVGRFDEAIAEGERAMALDPLSPSILTDLVMTLGYAGKAAEAVDLAHKAAVLDPTFFFPSNEEGVLALQTGNYREAIPKFERSRSLAAPPFTTAYLAYAYGMSGDRSRAMATLEDLKKMSPGGEVAPFNLALVSLGLGDRIGALDHLEQAYEAHSELLVWLKIDKIFDPLRSEPRFVALMKRLNFVK
jgi:serine/threonine-protein kinase